MTEGIVRADPARRRALLIVVLVCFAVFVLLYGLVGDPFEWVVARLLDYIESGGESDPAQARARAAGIVIGLIGLAWLFCAAIVGFYVLMGVRMWGAEQWPLPGARPIVDQRIRRGRTLRVSALILIVVPLLALAPLTYYSLRVALWALAGLDSE